MSPTPASRETCASSATSRGTPGIRNYSAVPIKNGAADFFKAVALLLLVVGTCGGRFPRELPSLLKPAGLLRLGGRLAGAHAGAIPRSELCRGRRPGGG